MTTDTRVTTPAATRPATRMVRWAQAALALGSASSIAFAGISVFTKTTDGTKDFEYTADYWYTGIGIPTALAGFVVVLLIHRMQCGRDGRLGRAGLLIFEAAVTVLAAMLIYSLFAAKASGWGGTYVIATLATFVGLSLFAAGSWRTGVLPRVMLALWPLAWLIGSFAAVSATPLLLAAFFATMAIILQRRA